MTNILDQKSLGILLQKTPPRRQRMSPVWRRVTMDLTVSNHSSAAITGGPANSASQRKAANGAPAARRRAAERRAVVTAGVTGTAIRFWLCGDAISSRRWEVAGLPGRLLCYLARFGASLPVLGICRSFRRFQRTLPLARDYSGGEDQRSSYDKPNTDDHRRSGQEKFFGNIHAWRCFRSIGAVVPQSGRRVDERGSHVRANKIAGKAAALCAVPNINARGMLGSVLAEHRPGIQDAVKAATAPALSNLVYSSATTGLLK